MKKQQFLGKGIVLNSEVAGASHQFGLFGEVNGTPPSISPTSSPVMYGWQGLAYDAESGQWNNHARQYNQNTGTFLSQEPLGAAADENFYRYVHNTPLSFVDPNGVEEMPPGMSREEYEAAKARQEAEQTTEQGLQTDWAGLGVMLAGAYDAAPYIPALLTLRIQGPSGGRTIGSTIETCPGQRAPFFRLDNHPFEEFKTPTMHYHTPWTPEVHNPVDPVLIPKPTDSRKNP